jgi:hypothetical protein
MPDVPFLSKIGFLCRVSYPKQKEPQAVSPAALAFPFYHGVSRSQAHLGGNKNKTQNKRRGDCRLT